MIIDKKNDLIEINEVAGIIDKVFYYGKTHISPFLIPFG
jgi:hypothetical protein